MQKINFNSKANKILYVLNLLSVNNEKIKFDDLVVQCFKTFPDTFSLDSYPDFPDSHKINRSIYTDLKPKGLIKTFGNNYYKLTLAGFNIAKNFLYEEKQITNINSFKFDKEEILILKRLFKTKAYALFVSDKKDLIVDSDFYQFFRISIRMSKNDFLSNLNLVKKIINEAKKNKVNNTQTLSEVSEFLVNKYSNIINKMETSK